MEAHEAGRRGLTDLEQVPEIPERVSLADHAAARVVDRSVAEGELLPFDVEPTRVRQRRTVAPEPGLHHAVELVDAELHRLDQ